LSRWLIVRNTIALFSSPSFPSFFSRSHLDGRLRRRERASMIANTTSKRGRDGRKEAKGIYTTTREQEEGRRKIRAL
jgi:hypothetical protein